MASGQYIKQNLLQSDADVTTVLSGETLSTGSYADSTSDFDCRGFREVDFFIHVDTKNGMSKIHAQPEAGQILDQSNVEYATYLTETISSGVATTNEYEVELNDPAPADGVVYKVTVPVEGRVVRVQLKVDNASSNPSVAVYAQRRV